MFGWEEGKECSHQSPDLGNCKSEILQKDYQSPKMTDAKPKTRESGEGETDRQTKRKQVNISLLKLTMNCLPWQAILNLKA